MAYESLPHHTRTTYEITKVDVCSSVWQCVAVCCSGLQFVAVCGSVLQNLSMPPHTQIPLSSITHKCDVTEWFKCHDSFICVPQLIDLCSASHSSVCQDSFFLRIMLSSIFLFLWFSRRRRVLTCNVCVCVCVCACGSEWVHVCMCVCVYMRVRRHHGLRG